MDIISEIFYAIFRFFAWIVTEIVADILIRGLGYTLCRPFSRRVTTESIRVLIVGIIAWLLLIGVAIYFVAQ